MWLPNTDVANKRKLFALKLRIEETVGICIENISVFGTNKERKGCWNKPTIWKKWKIK